MLLKENNKNEKFWNIKLKKKKTLRGSNFRFTENKLESFYFGHPLWASNQSPYMESAHFFKFQLLLYFC